MHTPFFNQHHGGAAAPPYQAPKPRQWPAWASPLKLFAQPGDRGLGDIVARKIGLARGAAFKAWFKDKFNRDCGCSDRQVWLNQMFPLAA
jgi:hypothetical protein